MPITPKIPTIPEAKQLDLVIQYIQETLGNNLQWLNYSFARAWKIRENRNGSEYIIPKGYTGLKEYQPLEPDDTWISHSFIYPTGDERPLGYQHNQYTYTAQQDLAIIFSVKLDNTPDYIYTQKLKEDALYTINRINVIKDIRAFTDEEDRVWRDWSYKSPIEGNWGFLRFDITVEYLVSCYGQDRNFFFPIRRAIPDVNNSNVLEFIAGENIPATRAVMLEDNKAFLYNPTDISNYGTYIGISVNTAFTGEVVRVLILGQLETTFPTIEGQAYYSDAVGRLVTDIPTVGISHIVATGGGDSSIYVNQFEPIILA